MRKVVATATVIVGSVIFVACGASGVDPDPGAQDATAETSDVGTTPEVDGGSPSEPPGRLRLIHVSDLHYPGTADDPRPEFLSARVARLNATGFEPDLVVSTGDHVDFLRAEDDAPGARTPLHEVREFPELARRYSLLDFLARYLTPGFTDDDVLLEVVVVIGQLGARGRGRDEGVARDSEPRESRQLVQPRGQLLELVVGQSQQL